MLSLRRAKVCFIIVILIEIVTELVDLYRDVWTLDYLGPDLLKSRNVLLDSKLCKKELLALFLLRYLLIC